MVENLSCGTKISLVAKSSGSAQYLKLTNRVAPRWNRGVLFQTSDISYHGLPDPIIGYERQSMANYYVSPLRPGFF